MTMAMELGWLDRCKWTFWEDGDVSYHFRVGIIQMYAIFKIHQREHSWYLNLILCKLYFNLKVCFKNLHVVRNLNYQLDWTWNQLRHTCLLCIPLHTSEGFSWSGYLKPEDPLQMWVAPSMAAMWKEVQGESSAFHLVASISPWWGHPRGGCCRWLVWCCYSPSLGSEPASPACQRRLKSSAPQEPPGQCQLRAAKAFHQVLSISSVKTDHCWTLQTLSCKSI